MSVNHLDKGHHWPCRAEDREMLPPQDGTEHPNGPLGDHRLGDAYVIN